MELNRRLITGEVIMLAVSTILYVLGFFVVNEASRNQVFVVFVIGLILMILHQFSSWLILYRFAITRKRMSNKLHMFNKLSVGLSSGFLVCYLIVSGLSGVMPNDESSIVTTALILVIMAVYIFIQENNTNNFVSFNFHKKFNQSKKTYNQMIGFVIAWLSISLVWTFMAIGVKIPVILLIFLFLVLVQNSLSYTTYGQSKYWNFVYELLWIGYVGATGLIMSNAVYVVIGLFFGLFFIIRQWRSMEYKVYAMIIGILVYCGLAALILVNPLNIGFNQMIITDALVYIIGVFFITFAIAFITFKPKFLAGLSTK